MKFDATESCQDDPRYDEAIELSALQEVDRQCEQFEQAQRGATPITVEQFLSDSGALAEPALLRELLAIELEYRARRGEPIDRDEYMQRFAGHETLVELALAEAASSTLSPAAPDSTPPGIPPLVPANVDAVPEFLKNHPRYEVHGLIAHGGMGAVYLAKHLSLDRDVALKVIRPELLARADVADRFRREAKAAARLNHPNIVAVFDAETAGQHHFLVMEYIAGADLFRTVRERGPLPVGLACDYIRQAAVGLQHAYECGMVHRDITPRNLMITAAGQIKILDFGLADFVFAAAPAQSASARGMLLGCVDFMAPEQAADPDSADIRADIYSLGCTLCFLLTGRPPFPEGSLSDKLRAHAEQPPPRLDWLATAMTAQRKPQIPTALAECVERMLSKNPAERFSTPAEVAAALAPWSTGNREADRRRAKGLNRLSGFFATPRRVAILSAVAVIALAITTIRGSSLFVDADTAAANAAVEEPPDPPEPHRLYREGLRLMAQRKEQQVHLAIDGRLEKAVELAPDFALAQTALADAYNLCGDYGWDFADDVFPKAKAAAQRAIEQDPKLAEAHLALAFVLHEYECDFKGAEAEYQTALKLNPKLAAAHHWYAWFLADSGRSKEALDEIKRARKLAPDDLIIVNNYGKLLYLAHDFVRAAEEHSNVLVLDPDFRKAHRDLGLAYAELGQLDEALAELDKSRGLTDDGRDAMAATAYAFARNHRPDRARLMLPEVEAAADHKPLAYDIATIYAALGDKDAAFEWLHRAIKTRSAARAGMSIDPRLDPLHDDPRWQPLVAKYTPPPPKEQEESKKPAGKTAPKPAATSPTKAASTAAPSEASKK